MNNFQHLKRTINRLLLVTGTMLFAGAVHANSLTHDNSRNLVYAGFSGTVAILDVNDPANPTLVSDGIKTQGVVTDLFYDEANKRLYIAANEGDLEILDVQNTSSPQLISNTKVYYYNTETPVISVAVKGNIAFVSTAWGYMHRLDVSDPSNPIDLGFDGRGGNPSGELVLNDDNSLLLAGPSTLHFNLDDNGNVLSSTMNFHDFSNQVFRDSGTTYTSRSNNLRISGADYVNTGENINDIYAKNNLVYIAAGSAGLRLWDVTDKNAPYIIGTDASQFANSVVVNGNYAYVSFFPTVRVVDISTPNNPVVVGEFDASGGSLGNISPVANASKSQVAESGETVTLNGTYSKDPDGSIVSYLWEQVSGTAMVLNNANTINPSFTALYNLDEQRVFQRSYFKLTVTDNEGATGSDTVQINISKNRNGNGVVGGSNGGNGSNTNTPPVADAGPALNVKSRQRKVKLDGRGSYDSDGTIVKYAWKQVSGKKVRLKRANRSVAKFRAPRVRGAAIQLVFELTVTDNKGEKTSSRVTVTVRK